MDWNRAPIEAVAPHELIPTAQEKKRTAEQRPWEQKSENAARRYRLPENLYGKVCRIATQNDISSISHVAIQLLDYALYQREQGNMFFQLTARPNPQGRKFRVVWKAQQAEWNKDMDKLAPDFERGKQKRDGKSYPGEYGGQVKDFGLRLGNLRARLRAVADELHLPLSEVVTFLLLQAVIAYEGGKFRLELEHIVSQTASGWVATEAFPRLRDGFPPNSGANFG